MKINPSKTATLVAHCCKCLEISKLAPIIVPENFSSVYLIMEDFTATYAKELAARLKSAEWFVLQCSQMEEPREIVSDSRLLEILYALCEVRERLEDIAAKGN